MDQSVKLTLLSCLLLILAVPSIAQVIPADSNQVKEKKKEMRAAEEEPSGDLEKEKEECKVLLPSISESYEGKCKNGLAHGKGKATGIDLYEGDFKFGYPHGIGIFTYQNGDVYTGSFKKGRMDGEGSLATTINNRDTLITGIWMEGIYAGPVPKHPRVLYSYGVDSYDIKKVREGNRFLVDIYLNGMANSDLENFTIVSTSGSQLQMGQSVGFENIKFPVVCKLSYKTWNKLRTSRHEVIFEFKIEEPGDWKVKIIN